MMYADTASGRAEAAPGLAGTCPSCGHPCRPKCGKINVWHWAHHAGADCDPWSEPMTEWHLGWQRAVPPERREVVMGPHRADIVTASGGVVEIQHSPVSPDVITAREEFYGEQMAWIFDATQADITVRPAPPLLANTPCGCANERCAEVWLQPGTVCRCQHEGCTGHMAKRQWKPSPDVRFRWKHARRSVAACRRPAFLDLGRDRVLRLPELFAAGEEMTGTLYTRASVEGWLRDRALLERFPLPTPPPPVSHYDPPYLEQYRTPDAWRADQERRRAGTIAAADRFSRWLQDAQVVPPPPSQRSGPAEVKAAPTSGEWLAAMLRIVPDVGIEACRKLWRETTEKRRKGELTEPDSVKVLDLLRARMEALGAAPPDAIGPAGVLRPVADPAAVGLDPRPDPERRLPIWRRIWQARRGRRDGPTRRPPSPLCPSGVPASGPVGAARELAAQLAELRYRLVDRLQRVLPGRLGFRLVVDRLGGIASHPDGRVDREGVRCGAQAGGHVAGVHRGASSSSRVRVTREPRPDSEVILIAARWRTARTSAGLSPPVTRSSQMTSRMRSAGRPARTARTVPGAGEPFTRPPLSTHAYSLIPLAYCQVFQAVESLRL